MTADDTLVTALEQQAAEHGDKFLAFPDTGERITTAELARASALSAAGLRDRGVPEDRVVGLLTPTGPAFFTAFFGVLRTGCAAAVLPLPWGDARTRAERLVPLLDAGGIRHLLVAPSYRDCADRLRALRPGLAVIPLDERGARPHHGSGRADALAVLQLTSGSTSAPKGVRLTHRAYLHGVRSTARSWGITTRDTWVGWMPHFHDFGLVTALAQLLHGGDQHQFAPMTAMRSPLRFLRHLAEQRGTATAGPNFFYDRLAEAAAADPRAVAELDLTALRLGVNGAEPVRPATLDSFDRALAPAGARPHLVRPAYGLAEATLVATMARPGPRPRVEHLDRALLADHGRARLLPPDAPGGKALASVGTPVEDLRLRIADPRGRPCPDGTLGEVQLQGPMLTTGYHRHPEATRELFDGPWLRTGDLGFLLDGELFVAGRAKDMIIVRGVNHFPEDVEAAARSVPGVHRGRCVAFAVEPTEPGEHLVLVAETLPAERTPELRQLLTAAVREQTGLAEVEVRLAPPGWIPRTSSGKWQRATARARLADTRLT